MIRLFNINLDFKKLNTCFFNSRLNLFVLLILLLNSCAPKLKIIEGHQINNEIRKQNQIYIFSLYEKLPENAQVIGKV